MSCLKVAVAVLLLGVVAVVDVDACDPFLAGEVDVVLDGALENSCEGAPISRPAGSCRCADLYYRQRGTNRCVFWANCNIDWGKKVKREEDKDAGLPAPGSACGNVDGKKVKREEDKDAGLPAPGAGCGNADHDDSQSDGK